MTDKHIGENFDDYKDHTSYFLKEDALHSLGFDVYFSPTTKYYCNANCKVCYIKKELKEGLPFYKDGIPEVITDEDHERWHSVFKYFYSVRTNDDLTYLRLNHPQLFKWYKDNAHMFQFCMTDNAVLIHQNTLLNHIDLKDIADISLSEYFLDRANKDGRVKKAIQNYMDKYGRLTKIKIIRTTDKPELSDETNRMIDWLNDMGVENSIQHDLRDKKNTRYNIGERFDYQVSYVMSCNNTTYQIYRESVQFYNDRFFYSIDDATDINMNPFHTMPRTSRFDPRPFLVDMIEQKLKYYDQYANELQGIDHSVVNKFRDYYETTIQFKVNRDFNFIPNFMLENDKKFYQGLVDYGFKHTDVGLYYPSGKAIPLVDYK